MKMELSDPDALTKEKFATNTVWVDALFQTIHGLVIHANTSRSTECAPTNVQTTCSNIQIDAV